MENQKTYAAYFRVSTQKQGQSGLGLESQRDICLDYIKSVGGECSAMFQDVESGKSRTRKGLWDAIEYCKSNNAVLVFAKLDRLARDIEFTFKVINTGVEVHFCDMPVVNTIILGVFASVAQYERELTSTRTKNALKAKKERDGSWKGLYGKNTGGSYAESCAKARVESAKSRKDKAQKNPRNAFFWKFVQKYEDKHGRILPDTDVTEVVSELNFYGALTATGLAFNNCRFKAMLTNCRRIFDSI
jgi:DNA invertase Pin-like site-specific DNA recombinase